MTTPHLRIPSGLKRSASARVGQDAEAQLLSDRETLRDIVAGLDRLELLVDQTPVFAAGAQRGYFTPDEDDRVRQVLLAYRNYRLAAYDIIFRYRDFAHIAEENLRRRCFLVAFAAALVLYAKSLKIIRVAEHQPLLRAKVNEPDAMYDLEAGFFDDVLVGYSSLSNYRALAGADRFWRSQRREIFRRFDPDSEWHWLCDIIRKKRVIVRKRLFDVLLRRLRYDWRAFWRTVLRPAREARYGLQSLLGGHFAGVYIVPHPVHVLTPDVLAGLRPQLQPGDILLCRAEGKLTAALLPGFWSHVAIYLGSRADLEALHVRAHPHAAKRWEEIPEDTGPLGCVIEGVAPRVRICLLETSLHADHVVVLRPNVSREELAAALGEAFGHLGKPYDFEFDFATDHALVCTELVWRSYRPDGEMKGLRVPLVEMMGRETLPANEIARLYADERGRADAQLEFVYFLDAREAEGRAVVSDEASFAATPDRTKWDVAQR